MKRFRVYGLPRFQNNECGITWDRDINASRNIHNIVVALLKGEARPEYLTRKFAQKKRAKVSKNQKAKATS